VLAIVGREAGPAQRPAGLERGAAALEDAPLGDQLGRLVLLELRLEALQAVADDGEVREQQLGLEQLEVAGGSNVALGVGHGR